ncbi:thiamine diphosphokinase [Helicovermis profundi]|uniref:Thiamine diphosphokinase n=1 Tax=Helicovermis profundi TaxID=3065157 RepID=A0AAU9E486_9FIRM|nr:thiamine diphosphokinase [Clostridia bacterium S502]
MCYRNVKEAIIVANGVIGNYLSVSKKISNYMDVKNAFVISVDGGIFHMDKLGLIPNIILGDFDSINDDESIFEKYSGADVIRYNSKKDFTDTELAIRKALDLGAEKLYLVGCTGERLDHTLANIFLLDFIENSGGKGYIIDSNNRIECLSSNKINLKFQENEFLSIIPISTYIEKIEISGMKYDLSKKNIKFGSTLMISNEKASKTPYLNVYGGKVLVIYSTDRV